LAWGLTPILTLALEICPEPSTGEKEAEEKRVERGVYKFPQMLFSKQVRLTELQVLKFEVLDSNLEVPGS
jgi:hypothetical protein